MVLTILLWCIRSLCYRTVHRHQCQSLSRLSADERHSGAEVVAVHTWTQGESWKHDW